MYFIAPSEADLTRALEAWSWLELTGKRPIAVTAFGDVFFAEDSAIWFLDTLEGALTTICGTQDELEALLSTDQVRDHYLSAGFVDHAVREGMTLEEGECYQYALHPALGGEISYANMQKGSFVVAVNLAGQIHQQIRHYPDGTRITGFTTRGA